MASKVAKDFKQPTMAAKLSKDFKEQVMNTQFSQIMYGDSPIANINPSSQTFTRSRTSDSQREDPISTSSYTLASEHSQFSNEVDLWVRGNQITPTESTGVQGSRVAVVQRSTLAPTSSLDANGMWYIMAMILPLFSVNNCMQWRCTPSTVLNAAEIFLAQLSTFCGEARAHIRRLAQDQIARDLFATAMDIVLVVYAIGFLVLSLYQASIIG